MKKYLLVAATILGVTGLSRLTAVEIPLESLTPARVGYVDLQKIFDTYPEKSYAEGDLLREIEKRKRELGQRQNLVNTLRQQIAVDEAALAQGKKGVETLVPSNNVPDLAPPPAAVAAPATASTSTVKTSTTAVVEPYPLEDPLAGLPGHESGAIPEHAPGSTQLPGMLDSTKKASLLDTLAASGAPVVLSPEAQTLLQKRIDENKKHLERKIVEFKGFRGNALADMKVLQTQKTYGVMSKIYAVLQTLARDEGVTLVLDKAYVLYGEDTVDLSEKLIQRLQQENQ